MTATEIETILRRGMCSPSRLAEGPCDCCDEKLRAVETVYRMERRIAEMHVAAERERAAADALAEAVSAGHTRLCTYEGDRTGCLACAVWERLAAYRAVRADAQPVRAEVHRKAIEEAARMVAAHRSVANEDVVSEWGRGWRGACDAIAIDLAALAALAADRAARGTP